jgi:hypothetical protein
MPRETIKFDRATGWQLEMEKYINVKITFIPYHYRKRSIEILKTNKAEMQRILCPE